MIQSVNNSNSAKTLKNLTFKSEGVNNSQPASTSFNNQERNDRYSRYVKEFNEIPKKANRFFWISQLIGTAIGALG